MVHLATCVSFLVILLLSGFLMSPIAQTGNLAPTNQNASQVNFLARAGVNNY